MKALVLLAAVLPLAACQSDTKNLNDRMERIEKKLDAIIAQGGRPGAAQPGAGQARPARNEPDKAKTYAVSIDGDPIIGAADAKITLIEAFDYA